MFITNIIIIMILNKYDETSKNLYSRTLYILIS